jgi:ABC-type proline/glycine betaine transport system permease subunit
MNRTISRGLRTLLQLVAAGGLTALIVAIAEGLPPNVKAIVLAGSALAVTLAQNFLEAHGKLPTILEDAHARKAPPA